MTSLERMERELRALRPQIDHEFAARLDTWAAEGFPAEGRAPAPARGRGVRPPRASLSLPRIAFAACALLIVGTVTVSVIGSERQPGESVEEAAAPADSTFPAGEPGTVGGEGAAVDAQRQAERGDAGVIAPGPTVPLPPGEEKLHPGREREVAREASIALSTDPGEVAEVADEVIEVTERYDGIVLRSDVSTEADRAHADLELRIPAQNLQATLADLSDLASVSERDESGVDVTAPFVTASERFADAKAEAEALLERLGEAEDAGEIALIRERLRSARAELAAARAELANLKQRTDFSRLSVTVVGEGDADGWSLGDAVDDAGSVLEDLAGAALVALAAIVPLGLLAAGVWIGLGAARRRSRERALDG